MSRGLLARPQRSVRVRRRLARQVEEVHELTHPINAADGALEARDRLPIIELAARAPNGVATSRLNP